VPVGIRSNEWRPSASVVAGVIGVSSIVTVALAMGRFSSSLT
jgi:hypothetical protein